MSAQSDFDEAIDKLCVLHDPVRRAVYRAVREAGRPPTRVEVAERAGVPVRLATFHLEKLADEGFLESSFRRRTAETSVGRPAKHYEPTQLDLEVAIPPRRYDIAAHILAAILEHSTGGADSADIAAVAEDCGQRLGRRVRRRRGLADRLAAALELVGYEAVSRGGDIVLRNCPFYRVAEARPDTICPMNRAFVAGILRGLRSREHVPVLAREAGRCCVTLTLGQRTSGHA